MGNSECAPDLTILPGRPEILAQATRTKSATWIEDYLDHLCAPLVGVVPWEERQLLRGEAAFHLERLANDYCVEGFSEEEAVRKAIVRYGESGRASESFLDTWYRRQPRGWFLKRFGLANGYAMFYFGLMAALSNALVQMLTFFPSPDPLTFAELNPAQIRRLIPEPLPIPEASPLFFALLIVAFVAPFIAGWLTGSAVDGTVATGTTKAYIGRLLAAIAAPASFFLFGESADTPRHSISYAP